jgi:hypothetical protein
MKPDRDDFLSSKKEEVLAKGAHRIGYEHALNEFGDIMRDGYPDNVCGKCREFLWNELVRLRDGEVYGS